MYSPRRQKKNIQQNEKKEPTFLRKTMRKSSLAFSSLILSALILVGCIYFYLAWRLPDVSQLKDIRLQVPLRIYTSDGKLIGDFGEKKRIPVALKDVPPQLINAILDTEDQRFYDHPGVDFIGVLRAAKNVFATGRKSQGASTITMQVARDFFLNNDKTYARKINEIMLALKIDQELTKQEILTLYVNKIYLGQRAYGVASAARIYYGKDLKDLSLAEIAMIAGLPQAPSRANPIANPSAALERRNHVLERMYDNGHISYFEYHNALKAPNTASYHESTAEVQAPYVAEMVRLAMIAQFGDEVYDRGYTVYTTIDSHLQDIANQALRNGIVAYDKRHGYRVPDVNTWPKNINNQQGLTQDPQVEGAFVALNPVNGAILALDGGFSYGLSSFNRATQSGRQTGSAIKPFIYSAALEKGFTLASVVNDSPLVINDIGANMIWRPQNDNQKFYGPTRLRVALAKSRNLVSIRLLRAIGIRYAEDYLSRFGFTRQQLSPGLALALGATSISPVDLTAGYATFANGGYKITPFFIDTIKDEDGKVIFKAQPKIAPPYAVQGKANLEKAADKNNDFAERTISIQNVYLLTDALKDVIRYGTARSASILKRGDLAGKTGTTNNQVDAWFCGFNGDVVAGVWVGYDKPQSLYEHGDAAALPIWTEFMGKALANKPENTMPEPEGIVTMRIDPKTGSRAAPGTPGSIFEIFAKDTTPKADTGEGSNSDSDSDSSSDSAIDFSQAPTPIKESKSNLTADPSIVVDVPTPAPVVTAPLVKKPAVIKPNQDLPAPSSLPVRVVSRAKPAIVPSVESASSAAAPITDLTESGSAPSLPRERTAPFSESSVVSSPAPVKSPTKTASSNSDTEQLF